MTDSPAPEDATGPRTGPREVRLDAIEAWVAYLREQPPEVWGDQLNRLVDSQLASARASGLDADHLWRVRSAGRDD